MAAVYFMGVKKVTSKKSGKDFYPANFLCLNNWGDWSIMTKFCADSSVYSDLLSVEVGSPVICQLGMQGELLQAVPHDSVPALLLDGD